MKIILFIYIFSLVAAQQSCSGTPNNNGYSTSEPTFNKSVAHGKLYYQDSVQPAIRVIHVYGTPYEMGYAHGQLLKEDISGLLLLVEDYIYKQVEPYLHELPEVLRLLITKFGVNAGLDYVHILAKKYIPQYFVDEMYGIADGAGISRQDVVRLHMIPELIKAHCSMYGAWGPATKSSNGTLIQLRSLDWITDGPFQKCPLVTVYHPNQEFGHPFSTVSWSGFVAGLTGFSDAPIAVCEKVWLSYNGTDSREGIPFHFLLRDILQFDSNIDDALSRIASAHRTCSIHIGLGDISGEFKEIDYAHQSVTVYDDYNFPEYPGHPKFKGLVYLDKHVQPSHNQCLGSLLQKYYGQITPENTIQYITSLHQTGDMHIAIYDFANKYMYVSNASPVEHFVKAYDRKFVRFNMGKLFNEKLY